MYYRSHKHCNPVAGEFLEAFAARLLATVDGNSVGEHEGRHWLKAASAIAAEGEAPRTALLQAIAQSPVATGDFGKRSTYDLQLDLSLKFSPVALRLLAPRDAPPVNPHVATAASNARGSAAAEAPSTAAKGKSRAPPPPRPVNKSAGAKPAVAKNTAALPSPVPDPVPEAAATPTPPSVMEIDDEDDFEPGSGYEVLREYLGTSHDAPTEPQSGHLPATGPMYVLREVVSREVPAPPRSRY